MEQRPFSSPPPTPPPPAIRPVKPVPKQSVEGSIKDTIEAILVAFMLAFIFRAFVVEAFVIPTGSMAPTLMGAHMRFRCQDCGYQFEVNYAGEGMQEEPVIGSIAPQRRYAIFCPNCGYRMPREDAADPDNDAWEPQTRYGDRILVLKFLYLFREAQRWDVVVFKSPVEPGKYDYTQNYIKRLVGRPNESILILDGDVYVGKGTDRDSFQVQTKPRSVQKALWRIVYDNDFRPRGIDRSDLRGRNDHVFSDPAWEQPWQPLPGQTGWTVDGADSRNFTFSNPDGAASILFDANANPKKFALTDWLAYDVTESQGPNSIDRDNFDFNPSQPENNVSDLMLEFYYERQEGDGPLSIQLTKLEDRFRAEIGRESVALFMNDRPLGEPRPLPSSSAPRHVEMSNVDYRVSLRIDGVELLVTTPEQYHPDIKYLIDSYQSGGRPPKPQVQITGQKQRSALSHVRLWRDVYYLNRERPNQNQMLWATPLGFPNGVMKLKDDEFFVLGDNSYVSLDARYWQQPINLPHENLDVEPGRVPRRFMLGKAFFVYWPAGYRPIDSAPALIPNFGDMRFIH